MSLLFTSSAWAHKDKFFPIDEYGNVSEIDDEFAPVSVVVRETDTAVPDVIVTLGNNEVHLPACIARLFVLPAGEQITAYGSWWHDTCSFPPYLVFELSPATVESDDFHGGDSVTFNLSTAEVMEVRKQGIDVALTTLCSVAERKALHAASDHGLIHSFTRRLLCIGGGVVPWLLGLLGVVLVLRGYQRRNFPSEPKRNEPQQ